MIVLEQRAGAAIAIMTLLCACGPLRFELEPDAGEAKDADFGDVSNDTDAEAQFDASSKDASADDAEGRTDASPPDVFSVRVHVSRGGSAAQGVAVVFHDSAGHVVSSTTTNAAGNATSLSTATEIATVIETSSEGDHILQTVTGLANGDTISFSAYPNPREIENATLEIVSPGIAAGAQRYEVYTACSSTAVPDPEMPLGVLIQRSEPCVGTSSTVAVLEFAYDAADDLVAYTATTSALSSTATTTISLPAWSADFDDFDFTGTGVPETSLSLGLAVKLVRGGLTVGPELENYSVTAGMNAAAHLRIPSVHVDRQLQLQLQFADGAISALGEPRPPTALHNYQIDLETQLLPKISVELSWPADHRPRLTWSAIRSESADAIGVVLATNGEQGYSWTMLVPCARTSTTPIAIDFPELPSAFMSAAPSMSENNFTIFEAFDWESLNGYSDVKQHLGPQLSKRSPFEADADDRFRTTARVVF